MKKTTILYLIGILFFFSCSKSMVHHEDSKNSYLKEGFKIPPLEAKPRALWDWVDGNFSLDEITHEMEEAAAKGMGGFDIWDVRKVVDENNIVPKGPAFMSDAYLRGIIHAINEAERLHLDLGLIIASGWNAGGAWTKPEHQTMGLFTSEKTLTSKGSIKLKLDFPKLRDGISNNGRTKNAIIPRNINGLPKYYKNIKVLAIPKVKDSSTLQKSKIIDVSAQMDSLGNFNWNAPKGKWKIIRYVCTNTGQPLISSTPNSSGPMIDHFNPEATVAHIHFFIDKIEEKLGKPIGESGLKYLYTDSYEVQGLLWTEKLLEVFEKQMGYSMIPFLPVFNGYTVESNEITDRFLYDYRKVWSDLIIDSHYRKATEICEEHGIGFVAEAAGPGKPIHDCPFESIKSSGVLSFPRGEFWHVPKKNPFFDKDEKLKKHFLEELQVLKGVSSASHLYNQKYVEAEAFTGLHLWVEGPGDLKATADRAFCEGLNRINFHTWPHTPKEAGSPGWTYAFGTQISENRIWWPMAKPWIDYLARTSFLLQQGNFVGDVLYYYGDEAPNFAPAKHINPSLGFGFDYDVTNTDIIINKLQVKDGNLVLAHGQKYKIMVLPEREGMSYAILQKLDTLISNGATVVGRKPIKSVGLKDWQQQGKKIRDLANKLWGKCDGKTIVENQYGKGKIVWGKPLKQVLKELNVIPDFDFKGTVVNTSLDYIHRTVTGTEIYFMRNTTNQKIHGEAQFRVIGKQPEFWNPITGDTHKVNVFSNDSHKTTIPITLEPNESIFIVFTQESLQDQIIYIEKDGKQLFPKIDVVFAKKPLFEQQRDNSQLVFNEAGRYKISYTNKKSEELLIEGFPNPIEITGSWTVHFPKERKGVGSVAFDSLYSWHKSKIFDIQFFSGIATYEKEITIPNTIPLKQLNTTLDLGTVRDLAHVYLNGKDIGISWAKPNTLAISKYVKHGKNILKIEVANTWHNRLCGDARLPSEERITSSNVTRLPNPWSYPMQEIPVLTGKNEYDLQEGGLLGPVKLKFSRKLDFK